ncbi:MAG TPA: N,N-dimethylformamidase beta subunit family domain-containing protein [Pseudonocardiaceae bacterium]|jgi:hypothetical protein|nr:N,N-dimethylformamidase beta subunit family domain-containing protein [Pseudonocardiaceae bacterium]
MDEPIGTPVSRRRLLTGAAAIAAATAVTFNGMSSAAASPASSPKAATSGSGYDVKQRFIQLLAGGDGVIYGRQADGTLVWYRHTGWTNGTPTWSVGNGLAIGSAFHTFRTVLATDDGQLFAVGADGSIRWYRYVVSDLNTGSGSWADAAGSVIGTGFNQYPRLFGGYDGVIYAVDTDGALWRYQYTAGDGSNGPNAWANGGAGVRIGSGFKAYLILLAGNDGVITGIKNGGELDWWHYDSATGAWDNGGAAITIGSGWGDGTHKQLFTAENGVIYGVFIDTGSTPGNDDTLGWYCLTNATTVAATGKPNWANGGTAATVGSGFTVEPTAALQGYPVTVSTAQGTSLGFATSTTLTGVTATVNRLTGGAQPQAVWGPVAVAGQLQLLGDDYRQTGCGWTVGTTVPVASSWKSGVYSLRLTDSSGLTHDVVFVVKPARPTAKIAVLLPTNTYNAYNTWDGHNQYSNGESDHQRTVTFQRPSTSTVVEPPGVISHTLYHDLVFFSWLDSTKFAYDCYIDADLDSDGSWLGQYSALILGSHPEYWSETMRQRVVDYVGAGGHLIYPGGNGFYERMTFVNDSDSALHRTPTGVRDIYENLGMSESQVIGATYNPNSYMDFYPYQVANDHQLLDGTGLSVGDTFGAVAYNGAASGWEVDSYQDGAIPGATLIAAGQNPNGGAALLFVPGGNGGWMFGASSISFNGALPYDAAVRQIMTNAINLALS